MSRPLEVNIGDRFGKWTVVGHPESTGRGRVVLCKCECGASRLVEVYRLVGGESASCSRDECCGRHDKTRYPYPRRLHRIWKNMKSRCFNRNIPSYRYYGARGIRVCDSWTDSFVDFARWAVTNGYADDLTIDRIDCDGDYCPENCRWVGRDVQARNKRVRRIVVVDGERIGLAEAVEKYGQTYYRVYSRLKCGWSDERAVKEAPRGN